MTSNSRSVPRLGLSRAEVALSIGVSVNTVDKMVEEGALPLPRKWHTRKIWIVAEVEAAMMRWSSDGPSGDNDDDDWTMDDGLEGRDDEPKKKVAINYPGFNTPRDPMKEYYDKLGFDPATMEHADLVRLQNEAHQRWIAEIPSLPLNKLEGKVLAQFAVFGANIKISSSDIKHCGPDTEERLLARGFIKTFPMVKYPDRIGFYMLTDAGFDAASDLLSRAK
ncbi:AlpA family transcriptional regulator [Rhizobium rhizogenes]|uniref:helix-turn-helix transcriptional regulator n=1 Tax=Rhizobium rhizogenes TaxID=359 RepID=UPI001F1A2D53|nr:hypothetical protein [Rhizobium rhizogenes]